MNKEFTVTKIEKYSKEIDSADKKIITRSMYTGANAAIFGYLIYMISASSDITTTIPLLFANVGLGILSIKSLIKQMVKKAKLKDELVDEVTNQIQSDNQEIENKGKSR